MPTEAFVPQLETGRDGRRFAVFAVLQIVGQKGVLVYWDRRGGRPLAAGRRRRSRGGDGRWL
ncbi:MAG: hypothetical protein BLM47_04960 [Candidatus Reconcilbacillus cellulovorans]|uniref:Uncharacterized protein n=1 Tax=Candidatus Reconcilbacillus cellulovorans TaxID=1906605 RepID=A0A2A6E276_9BACL|nr:MAG: hypothetical protein BLM47_04960 [Candidatus Reconcilbacillus cellulovorans]